MSQLVREFHEHVRQCIPDSAVRVILDLGSRDAHESLCFAELYPHARIYAFECHPQSVQKCTHNARHVPSIEVVPLAAHNANGPIPFQCIDLRHNGNIGASSLFKASGEYDSIESYPQIESEVEGTRIDTWARLRGIDRVDLLWMDLQGAELLALNGMGRLLETVLAIHTEVEYREIYSNQVLFPQLNTYLTDAGFTLLRNRVEVNGWYGDAIYGRTGLKWSPKEHLR